MMRKLFSVVFLTLLLFPIGAFSQKIDPPTEPPPTFVFNVNEVRFGSQGVGVQSCMYITIANTTAIAQSVQKLYVVDRANYAIPSPTPQMMPISIQPHGNLTISLCFKPSSLGNHDSRVVLVGEKDSVSVGVQGKGLKPEDMLKKPAVDFVILKPSKKEKAWRFKMVIMGQSRVTLQLFDELGALVRTFLDKDIKPEGVFELPFDGTDKGKQPLTEGTYYARCLIDEIGRNAPQTITRIFKIGK